MRFVKTLHYQGRESLDRLRRKITSLSLPALSSSQSKTSLICGWQRAETVEHSTRFVTSMWLQPQRFKVSCKRDLNQGSLRAADFSNVGFPSRVWYVYFTYLGCHGRFDACTSAPRGGQLPVAIRMKLVISDMNALKHACIITTNASI